MEGCLPLKTLVIGYGSIGQRHARLLAELGCQVAVMSRCSIEGLPSYSDLPKALARWQPDYVVVANRTSEHHQTIEALVKYGLQGRVLIEKPLFDQPSVLSAHTFTHEAVAYNLRCHPLLAGLKSFLDDSANVVTANIYVGSYLPDWRPNTDYRLSYSAKKSEGGGVLRDLSHELDYVLWFFGAWRRLTALGGQFSQLEIDSDDACSLLMETERCPLVSIHMNYLDRVPRREISVNTDRHTVRADLIKNTLEINGVQESFNVDRDDTYRAQHQAMLDGNVEGLCTLGEAMETLFTIEAAEQATLSHRWIER
jgi:predicted dehydrogenase